MDKKGNNIRSKNDFLRYRRGDMTNEERNSFERDLQKDPFAEEAAEGLSHISANEAEKELNEIAWKIRKRTRINSPAIYYRIAAGVAVLVTISVIFFGRKKESEVMLSKSDFEKPETTLVIAASEPVMDKTEKEVPGRELRETVKTDSHILPVSPSPTQPDNQQLAISAEVKDDEQVAVKETLKAVTEEQALVQPSESGKKMEMSEVAGVAAPMAAKSRSGAFHIMPQPVTGIDSFNIYLRLNVRNPQPESDQERFVTISFTVKTDSTLTNLKIIDSPGQAYTREAKRLIKEGPLWKPAMTDGKQVEEEYRVTIRFR